MEVVASAKEIGVSPRKVAVVLDAVRGKKVTEALTILSFLPTPTARTVAKVVKSAAANAENNYQMVPAIIVDGYSTSIEIMTVPIC